MLSPRCGRHLLDYTRIPRSRTINQVHRIRIEVGVLDTKIIRERRWIEGQRDTNSSVRGATGKKRGTIEGRTPESAGRLKHLVRNQTRIEGFATVTYPPRLVPTTKEELDRHRERFVRSLKKRDTAAIIVREMNRRGGPHYHLLTDRVLQAGELAAMWRTAIGADEDELVWAKSGPARDCAELAGYLSKTGYAQPKRKNIKGRSVDHDDDHTYQGIDPYGGKWWTTTGGMGTISLLAEIEGNASEIAPLVRNIKRIEAAQVRKRMAEKPGSKPYKRKDGGRYGFTSRGLSKRFLGAHPELLGAGVISVDGSKEAVP